MSSVPKEVYIANLLFIIFWVLIVGTIIKVKENEKIRYFKDKMLENWRQALVIAAISYIGGLIGDIYSLMNNSAIGIFLSCLVNLIVAVGTFCECIVGLTIAKSIGGFEPLPITKAIAERKQQYRKILFMFLFAFLAAVLSFLISQIGQSFCQNLFGETVNPSKVIKMLPEQKWLTFFMLLSGAGIGEEAIYRLLFLSLFLRLTKKSWLSVILSSAAFGIYHLTPLNQMYNVYWQYPLTQFVSVTLAGIVFGYFYIKRGYETAVLGHTLSDWLPMMIFMK